MGRGWSKGNPGRVAGACGATDTKERMALHMACAVRPGGNGLGEPNGIRTATVLLEVGADLEAGVPIEEDEEDFRATPVWYAVARGENLPLVRFLLRRGRTRAIRCGLPCGATMRC